MTTKKQITAHKLANTDQAVEDLELTDLDFRLLALMVKLSDGETGIVRRMQTELAGKLGIHPRTVQRGRDHLVERGYLRPIGQARKGFVQAYKVYRGREATPAPHPIEKRHQRPQEAAPASQRSGPPTVHSPLSIPFSFPSDHRGTDDRGPRQRADALGPPFGEFDAELRQRLGEDSKWLALCKLVERSGDTVTLSALTSHQADNIRAHCEPAILAASGASRLEFVVAINTADPFLARRAS